jgi:uncharacterized repeat protein (TIGR01451 family)
MKIIKMKNLVYSLAVMSVMAVFGAVNNAQAVSFLTIQFENTPLFSEANIVPGYSVTRWVKVTNTDSISHEIATKADAVSDADHFGDKLNLVIKEGATVIYSNTLTHFFAQSEVFLSNLAADANTQYDYTISFNTEADNAYQGKSLGFDIVVGSRAGESIGDEVCTPGAIEACGDCGGHRICNDSGQWGTCEEYCGGGGGACTEGQIQSCGCGGTQTCIEGQWGSCEGSNCEGGSYCQPGTYQACGCGGTQLCSDLGAWGDCYGSNCGGGGGGSGGGGGGGGGIVFEDLIISNVQVSNITTNTATVTWLTNKNATSRVIYGLNSVPDLAGYVPPYYGYDYTTLEQDLSPKVTGHSVLITGLIPNTKYFFRPASAASPEKQGPEVSFVTAVPASGTSSDGSEVKVLGETGQPALNIQKILDKAFYNPGDTVIVKIKVSNNGNLGIFNTVVNDVLPAGFSYENAGINGTWNLGNINPGESKEINLSVKIAGDVKTGVYASPATAKADNHALVTAEAEIDVRGVSVLGIELEQTGFSIKEFIFILLILLLLTSSIVVLKKKYLHN